MDGGKANVTINGGDVTGISEYGAGIGGGQGRTATVTINGGTVLGKGGYGAGIGSGSYGEGEGGVTINGGTVTGQGKAPWSVGIGGGNNGSCDVTIVGGTVDAAPSIGSGTITAAPEADYGLFVTDGDGVRVPDTPFIHKKGGKDVTSVFAKLGKLHIESHRVWKVNVGAIGGGSAISDYVYAYEGLAVKLGAFPNSGSQFVGWESSDVEIDDFNVFKMPAKDVTVKAKFKVAPSVYYLNSSGLQRTCNAYTLVDSSTAGWGYNGLQETWYVVSGDVQIDERVQVQGNVNLILTDGCHLEANVGIHVPKGSSLTIYVQSVDNPGALTANTLVYFKYNPDAGIGGDKREYGGTLTINGGNISGISSGSGIGNCVVVINDGTISAKSSSEAALGSAVENGTDVTINGGTVTAEGSQGGIGGYFEGKEGSVTINGGTIDSLSRYGSGIGGGNGGQCDVIINGGTVTGKAGSQGPGIGNGNVTINGGTVTGIGNILLAGIGLGDVTITGGAIHAYGGERSSGFAGGKFTAAQPQGKVLQATDGSGKNVEGSPFSYAPGGTDISKGIWGPKEVHIVVGSFGSVTVKTEGSGTADASLTQAVEGTSVKLTATPAEGWNLRKWRSDKVSVAEDGTFTMPQGDVEVTAVFQKDQPYIDENGEQKICTGYAEATDSSAWGEPGKESWVVARDGSLNDARIEVRGDVRLILADGYEFKAGKGIHVPEGSSLTVYGESADGTGVVVATAPAEPKGCAGIGGNVDEDSGSIAINGGTVNATAEYGAGIGGGAFYASGEHEGFGNGHVTINGGTVNSLSAGGAGIGGGPFGGGEVTVNGGSVTGRSAHASGIGAGLRGTVAVVINGGSVTGEGTVDAAGIGCGMDGVAEVTVTGGSVDARGAGNADAVVTGPAGFLKVAPQGGYSLKVELAGGVQVEGSPFVQEKVVTGLVSGQKEVHVEAVVAGASPGGDSDPANPGGSGNGANASSAGSASRISDTGDGVLAWAAMFAALSALAVLAGAARAMRRKG